MSTLEPVAMPDKVTAEMEKTTQAPRLRRKKKSLAGDAARSISSPWASVAAIVIAVLWTVPTIGLLVTSFRPEVTGDHRVHQFFVDIVRQRTATPGQATPDQRERS